MSIRLPSRENPRYLRATLLSLQNMVLTGKPPTRTSRKTRRINRPRPRPRLLHRPVPTVSMTALEGSLMELDFLDRNLGPSQGFPRQR